jgi:hypothetical protein
MEGLLKGNMIGCQFTFVFYLLTQGFIGKV